MLMACKFPVDRYSQIFRKMSRFTLVTLFSGTGIHFLNESNSISRINYANDYILFTFDLISDLSANCAGLWNLVKHGSLRLVRRNEIRKSSFRDY